MKTQDFILDKIIKWIIFNPYWFTAIIFFLISYPILITQVAAKTTPETVYNFGFWFFSTIAEVLIIFIMYVVVAMIIGNFKWAKRFYDPEVELKGKTTYYQNRYAEQEICEGYDYSLQQLKRKLGNVEEKIVKYEKEREEIIIKIDNHG